MNYLLDAGLFLLLVAVVALACWRVAGCFQQRASVAVACFAGYFGLAGTFVWLVGLWRINAATCALVFLALLIALWLAPARFAASKTGREYGRIPGAPRSEGGYSFALADWCLLLYIAAICALTFVVTLAPPTSNDYDSLVYHLAAPAQWLRAGRAIELPYDHHSYFPFGLESLYAAGLAWRGAVFAKLFHWLMLPLCCAAIWALGRRDGSSRAGLLGAALWASLPVVQNEAASAYIDLGMVAFALVAVLCFLNWRRGGSARWLLACGLFCGLCLGTKYLGALVFGWLGIWIIAISVREKRPARVVVFSAALGLFIGGGWYLRNWLWTGSPVFPFAYEVFGGRGWTQKMATDYTISQNSFGWGRAPLDFLLLPWRLSFTPLFAVDADGPHLFETAGLALSSILGPALLALGAPLLFVRGKTDAVRFYGWTFAFLFGFWMLTVHYLRYLLPAFALGCAACGWGLENFLRRGTILKTATAACFVLWLFIAPLLTLWNARNMGPILAGRETPDQYLRRSFTGYDAMTWASQNANTPADARFAVWGEPRCFYLQRDYFFADTIHNTLVNNSAPLLPQLKKLRATHVLINRQAERNSGVGAAPATWEELVNRGDASRIYSAYGYDVYQLR